MRYRDIHRSSFSILRNLLPLMLSRDANPITIVTSPPSPGGLPDSGSPTPTKTAPVQYRIEERRRTVYVTSEVPPAQWDPQTVSNILQFADIPETEIVNTSSLRRTKSLVERDIVVFEDSSNKAGKTSKDSPPPSYRSGKQGSRSSMILKSPNDSNSSPDTPTPHRGSPRTPTRHRILFYHRHDPHYGFTNFSPHPVMYQGKRYPTSEHLFQSFKVCFLTFTAYNANSCLVPRTSPKSCRAHSNLFRKA